MNKTKLISPAKINFDLKIKYYDENYKKHKISSKVVLLKIKDLIFVSDHSKLQITYHDHSNKIINLKNDIIKKTITFFDVFDLFDLNLFGVDIHYMCVQI